MLFSSPPFFLFFAVYFLLHVALPVRYRLALIITGSAVFYAWWNPWYLWIPFAFVAMAFYGAIWVMDAPEGSARKRRLAATVAMLLVPLAAIKYSAFAYNDVAGPLLALGSRIEPWPLPLGISFVTFTTIAYVVDVYHGIYRLERDMPMLAGLVLFFPHLIAGPILRPAELLPQLHHPKPRDWTHAGLGVAIFTLGLVKKLVFADSFADPVERVFAADAGAGLSVADYLLAIYGFSLQIYCDFSGYTDMALGAAILLGVKLPQNFQRPYAATSVIEFWKRWHITLSRWLRDYLYIPLGGNRLGVPRRAFNLLVTMALGGLWHGANWTFVIWGTAHGLGLAVVHTLRKFVPAVTRLPRWIAIPLTFHFVSALWIFFRSPDVATAARVAQGPFVAPGGDWAAFASANGFTLGLLAVFLLLHRWDDHQSVEAAVKRLPLPVLIPLLALGWALAIAVSHGSSAKFIYFDF
jgi:alginate O-acetyltransferase complex protein AlgI